MMTNISYGSPHMGLGLFFCLELDLDSAPRPWASDGENKWGHDLIRGYIIIYEVGIRYYIINYPAYVNLKFIY